MCLQSPVVTLESSLELELSLVLRVSVVTGRATLEKSNSQADPYRPSGPWSPSFLICTRQVGKGN